MITNHWTEILSGCFFFLGALCRSLAFYNSSRPISRPPSYRSVVADQSRNASNGSNANRADNLSNGHQDKLFSTSQKLKKDALQENSGLKDNVHRVTIHQTTTSSQVCTNGVNIVSISSSLPIGGARETNQTRPDDSAGNSGRLTAGENSNEVILAHL